MEMKLEISKMMMEKLSLDLKELIIILKNVLVGQM
jgi:hypothetical protein